VSDDEQRREPAKRGGKPARGKKPGQGASRGGRAGGGRAGGGRAGDGRAGGGGRGAGRDSNRKRVPRAIHIGVVVEPDDVVDRSAHNQVLEVDAGLAVLTERMVTPWVERTPEGFVLDVRVPRLLTHHAAPIESLPPEVRDLLPAAARAGRQVYADDLPAQALEVALDRVLASVAPLHEFGRLGALVFPFPSYFVPGTKALDYLEWLRARAGDLPIAVELRHRDWVDTKSRDETMAFLSAQQLSYVCVDAPPNFPTSLPPLAVATTDTAFVRFHGRNADAWEAGADTGDDRFSYDYRRGDLEPWAIRLTKLASTAKSVHAIFTTGRAEAATRDARLLVKVFTEEPEPERTPPPSRPGPRGRRPPPRR
jgi:uncharacterized protein YecE (DUF72 family)